MAERTRTTGRRAAARDKSGKAGGARAGTRPAGSAARAAAEPATSEAAAVTRPERLVVEQPPPDPDYPRYRVEPGSRLRLADVDPEESERYRRKKDVAEGLKRQRERIADLQARLYAENARSLLIVLQAMDTGGKDGTIKGVFQGVNPQGCRVASFKAPSEEELDHDFLWRYHKQAPAKGMIQIFNRSHYEDVLVVRVKQLVPEAVWRPRYQVINQFEQALTLAGTTVLKFVLHISKDEQKRRLESRLTNPDKRWKFKLGDLKERPSGTTTSARSRTRSASARPRTRPGTWSPPTRSGTATWWSRGPSPTPWRRWTRATHPPSLAWTRSRSPTSERGFRRRATGIPGPWDEHDPGGGTRWRRWLRRPSRVRG